MSNDLINERMTAEQVAERFGYSVASIQTKFKRTQLAIKKKFNVEVIKCHGIDGIYYMVSEKRADTMFEEEKEELYIPFESLKIEDFAFYVLIAIAATPQGVFRGTRRELLRYMGVAASQKNQGLIDNVLILWMRLNILVSDFDEDIITVHMRRAFERVQVIPIKMLQQCQRIVQRNHKQNIKIAQLVKVWQAHRLCEKNQPFTLDDIQKYVDLSKNQIKDARNLLNQSDVLKITAARLPGTVFRKGSNADLNAIYDESEVEIFNQ